LFVPKYGERIQKIDIKKAAQSKALPLSCRVVRAPSPRHVASSCPLISSWFPRVAVPPSCHCVPPQVAVPLHVVGPSHCRWAVRIVVGPSALSLCLPCCHWGPSCCCWAMHLVVGLFVLSLGPVCCRWAPRIVMPPSHCRAPSYCHAPSHCRASSCRLGPFVSSCPFASWFSPPSRCWALRVVVGPFTSFLGLMRRSGALHAVVVPFTSLSGLRWRRWALCVVIGLYVASLGRRWVRRVVVRRRSGGGEDEVHPGAPYLALGPPCAVLSCPSMSRPCGFRTLASFDKWVWGHYTFMSFDTLGLWSVGGRKEGGLTHRMGFPLPGSPLLFLPPKSLYPARSTRPTSLSRGEGHGVAEFP